MPVSLVTAVGGSTSNSYASVPQAEAYIESHFVPAAVVTKWNALTEDQKAASLIRATQLLDRHVEWPGDVASVGQALSWPRAFTYDRYGRAVDSSVIPGFLLELQIDTALWLVNSSGVVGESTSSGEFDEIKVGPIEINFTESATSGSTLLPSTVIAALDGLGGKYIARTRGGIGFANVIRT